MQKALILIFTFLILTGCASAPLNSVPVIKADRLQPVVLPKLKPQSISLTVTDLRPMNLEIKNEHEVEAAVSQALTQALSRGGIQLSSKSPNSMIVTLNDCESQTTREGSACVHLLVAVKTKNIKYEFDDTGSNGYGRANSNYAAFGDISQSYQQTLEMFCSQLNKKSAEIR